MNWVKECLTEPRNNWMPDHPDLRDYNVHAGDVYQGILQATPPASVDLGDRFPAVKLRPTQMNASAFACGELLEYFLREFEGKLDEVSKWFLHYVTHRFCDGALVGLSLRATLKALSRVGVPPARCETSRGGIMTGQIDDPILFAYAKEIEGLAYHRIDGGGDTNRLTEAVRCLLAAGLPMVFGFPVPSSITEDARIDWRATDSVVGLSAGILVGYDDKYRIVDRGALKFRSVWGSDWGDSGYGWLPYGLLCNGIIRDVWTISLPTWTETEEWTLAASASR